MPACCLDHYHLSRGVQRAFSAQPFAKIHLRVMCFGVRLFFFLSFCLFYLCVYLRVRLCVCAFACLRLRALFLFFLCLVCACCHLLFACFVHRMPHAALVLLLVSLIYFLLLATFVSFVLLDPFTFIVLFVACVRLCRH